MKDPNNNKCKLVTFIIAAYNAEKYVKDAVNSCLSQTYTEVEVVITNDGSTDGTLNVLLDNFQHDYRVKILSFDKNQGKIAAFNNSFQYAKGKYIAIMSADDVSTPDRIQKSLLAMEKFNTQCICGQLSFFNHNLTIENKSKSESSRYGTSSSFINFDDLLAKNIVFGATMLASQELLSCVFPIPSVLVSEDWWLPLKISKISKILFLKETLLLYRIHESNDSLHLSNRRKTLSFDLWKKHYTRQIPFFKLAIEKLDLSHAHFSIVYARMIEQQILNLSFSERILLLKDNFRICLANHKSPAFYLKILSPRLSWLAYLLIMRLGIDDFLRKVVK